MKNKIFVVSGGTGGHIIPSICLVKHLKKEGYKTFLFGDKKVKSYLKNNQDVESTTISSSQIGKATFSIFTTAFKILLGIVQSSYFIAKEQPKYIVSFGGYATFPMLYAAVFISSTKKIIYKIICKKKLASIEPKIIIHEQNSHLGKVNRIFAPYAYKIATSFEETSGIKNIFSNKIVFTGTPIREEIINLHKNQFNKKEIENNSSKSDVEDKKMGYDNIILTSDFYQENKQDESNLFKIFIVGGSGGAKIFSEILPKAFFNLTDEAKNSLKIIQQCREELVESTFREYQSFNINVTVDSFFNDMDKLINEADLVIARAGASSVFEFCAAKKPMILVPFERSADNHQEKNANYFGRNGAAIVVHERNFTINKMNDMLKSLIYDHSILKKMSENSGSLAILDATQKLSSLLNE